MSEEEVKVGSFAKPARRPIPTARTAPVVEAEEDGIAELNAKMDQMVKFMQAIDWKMWVYLKANNYID